MPLPADHLMNILLHAAAACLVALIARRLALPGAWLAGFVFALHPVCVEAVAWISEQKSTLSAVFYLASALVYLRFDGERKRSQYFAAAGLFVLAVLTKTVTATLPAALLVVIWWKNGRLSWRRDVMPLLPLARLRHRGGNLYGVGRVEVHWRKRNRVRVDVPRTNPAGWTCHLVLRGESGLALRADLYLSALADRRA